MPLNPGAAAIGSILVIDDEPQIRRVVRNALADVADSVIEASSARAGLDLAASASPELIILDLTLPDADGVDVCRDLRSFTRAPILVLSARHSERDKVGLLDAGADDYLTKPFQHSGVAGKRRALSRRAVPLGSDTENVVIGDLEISVSRRSVHRAGAAVHLTPTEWGLLRALLTNRGRTMTHRQLFRSVWGTPKATHNNTSACTSDSCVASSKLILSGRSSSRQNPPSAIALSSTHELLEGCLRSAVGAVVRRPRSRYGWTLSSSRATRQGAFCPRVFCWLCSAEAPPEGDFSASRWQAPHSLYSTSDSFRHTTPFRSPIRLTGLFFLYSWLRA